MASDPGHLYYCYHCERTVQLVSPDTLICADCNSDFIEERSNGSPSPEDNPDFTFNEVDYMGPGFGQLLEDMSNFLSHMQVAPITARAFESDHEEPPHVLRLGTDARALSPILLLQGRIQNLLNSHSGDYVFDNGGSLRLPGTIGDYFVGHGIDHLVQHLSENDPNKYGTPPASKSAVDALPTISISEEHLGTDAAQCAVCKDEFELSSQVKQLPCNHMYHPDCILPWLDQHNSCPVCRYELPTDDPDYEQTRAQRRGGEFSGANRREALHEDERVHDAFMLQSLPGQPVVARYPTESDSALEQQDVILSVQSSGAEGGISNGSNGGSMTGRRFSLPSPWLRTSTPTASQHHGISQEEGLSHGSDAVEVTEEWNVLREHIIRGLLNSVDNDGDTAIFETRPEDLD